MTSCMRLFASLFVFLTICLGQSVQGPYAGMRLEHQRVLDAIIGNLAQHYFDPAVAHQIADALIAHQLRGDDDPATPDKDFAALLTAQMREVSHDLHLEVMYSALPPSQSSPHEFARKLESLKNDNCSFKTVQSKRVSNPRSQAAESVVKCGYGSADERSHGKTTDTARDSADSVRICN